MAKLLKFSDPMRLRSMGRTCRFIWVLEHEGQLERFGSLNYVVEIELLMVPPYIVTRSTNHAFD